MMKFFMWVMALLLSLGAIFLPSKDAKDASDVAASIEYGGEDEVFGIGYELSSDGSVFASGGMMNADSSPLGGSGAFTLELPEEYEHGTCTITFTLDTIEPGGADANGADAIPVEGCVTLKDGESCEISLLGSAERGYTLEYEILD